MQELMVDFITSLDGYGAAEGWPGWWGLQAPEYLAWLNEESEGDRTYLMGANTYRLMYGFATEAEASDSDDPSDEEAATSGLTDVPKVVFSSTLEEPLSWANSQLVNGDAVEAVRAMKRGRHQPDEHDRQPHVVPVAPRGGIGGSFQGGCLPRDHGKDRARPDLRRLSRCRPRPDCPADVRRQHPAARICTHGARRTTRSAPRLLTTTHPRPGLGQL